MIKSPIPKVTNKLQYRAIGIINGTYKPSDSNQLNRGVLVDKKGKEIAYNNLIAKDPEVAKNIHPNDTQRIVRALEVIEISKTTMSSFFKRKKNFIPKVFPIVIDRGKGSDIDAQLKNRV